MKQTKRQPGSLFSVVTHFINQVPVGSTYKTANLRCATDGVEVVTVYKRWNKNPSERTLKYQTMLKRGGFVKNIKRGEWTVLMHIPEWFTLSHLNVLVGYPMGGYSAHGKNSDGRTIYKEYRRLKMTKEEIQSALVKEHLNNHPIESEEQLRREYPANIDVIRTPAAADTRALADSYIRPATTVKISAGESQFYKTQSATKQRDQLMENLRENIGLIGAAVLIIDQVQILDPLVQGRVVNIYHQLKALQETVGGRIEYNRTQPNTNI
jgi:hypothetical protein